MKGQCQCLIQHHFYSILILLPPMQLIKSTMLSDIDLYSFDLNSYTSIFFRGEVINGGFGLVLDGSTEAEERAKMMLSWDVSNGVSKIHYIPSLHYLPNFYIKVSLKEEE